MVTGANSGCGLELSLFLARRGARLYMVCRNRERAEKALLHVTKEVVDRCTAKDVESIFDLMDLEDEDRQAVLQMTNAQLRVSEHK